MLFDETSIMVNFRAPTQYYPHKFTKKKLYQRVRHLKINKVQSCYSSDLDLKKIPTDECKELMTCWFSMMDCPTHLLVRPM